MVLKSLQFTGFAFFGICNKFDYFISSGIYSSSYNLSHRSVPFGKIPHKNVIRRHDETRRRNDLGNWLYMKVFRTSFYVATFSRRCDNVVYVAMSSFFALRVRVTDPFRTHSARILTLLLYMHKAVCKIG